MRNTMWTAEDWARVVEMRAAGSAIRKIALSIGRTFHQVRSKICWEAMTAEQRENRAFRMRRGKSSVPKTISTGRSLEHVRICARPSPESLEERDRRYSAASRDLTGAFFGDPKVGYSALDRQCR